MRSLYIAAITAFLMTSSGLNINAVEARSGKSDDGYRFTLRMFDHGMYSRSRQNFEELSSKLNTSDPEGYAVLCDLRASVPGAELRMNEYISRNPHSVLVFQLKWQYALNRFDAQDYKNAGEVLSELSLKHLYKSQHTEYLFRKAYCDLETRNLESACENFKAVEKRPFSDYTAPSRYALGYIAYVEKNFEKAIEWFTKSGKDARFREMSNYYVMECHFMLGHHYYVTAHGDEMLQRKFT